VSFSDVIRGLPSAAIKEVENVAVRASDFSRGRKSADSRTRCVPLLEAKLYCRASTGPVDVAAGDPSKFCIAPTAV
jgi:hypothetical protein